MEDCGTSGTIATSDHDNEYSRISQDTSPTALTLSDTKRCLLCLLVHIIYARLSGTLSSSMLIIIMNVSWHGML